MIKMFRTYRRAKDMFVKPSVSFYFGNWKRDHNYIGGYRWRIYLCPRKKLHTLTYPVKNMVMIKTGTKDLKWGDKTHTVDVYENSYHKLPGKLTPWDSVWNRDIRQKLRKYHLGWLPPVIYLPAWLGLGIYDLDVGWKTKYDDVRYENPPVFSIRFFGLSMSFSLHCPVKNGLTCDDHYWESILTYLHDNKSQTLLEAIEHMGIWGRHNNENEIVHYFAVRPEYIKPKHLEEYYAAISTIRTKYDYEIL